MKGQDAARPVICDDTDDPLGQSRWHCIPYRGGTALQRVRWVNDGSTPDGPCTITLWARNDSGNGLGHRYFVTAGHCAVSTSGWQYYWHDGIDIGESNSSGDHTLHGLYPATDGRLIRTVDYIIPHQQTNMNRIYKWSGEPNEPVTTVKDQTAMTVGASICKSGLGYLTFGSYCGTVTNLNTTLSCPGGWGCNSYGTLRTSIQASGGDSGATVWKPSVDQLWGIGVGAVGNPKGDMLFVSAQSVENNLWTPDGYNLGFCMNADCTAWDNGL